MSASRKTFLASVLAHGLLFALLTPWLTMAAGSTPKLAEVQSRLTTPPGELVPEPPAAPPPIPQSPEDPPPAECSESVPPEEAPTEAPLFDRPVEPSLSSAFAIPVERSIAVRSARNHPKEPAPEVASAPPPVRTFPVSTTGRRVAGPSRQAMPAAGNPAPEYPARARELAHQGVVVVVAHLDQSGTVLRVEILKGSGYVLLDREALRAVGSWQFSPALQNGVAVPSRLEVPIRFRIR